MVLGLSSFTYGWSIGVPGSLPGKRINELDLVNRTASAGLHLLQIGDNLPLHELTSERRDQLKASLKEHNITLEVGARKLTAEHLQRYIDLATFFNASLLRFVIDGHEYEPRLKDISSIIKEALPDLRKNNITLGIENHDRFKASELAGLMDTIGNEQVGICLDCVNSLGAGEGLDWVVSVLAPYTVNLHIKDFIIKRFTHNMGFTVTGTPTGQGMTNVPMLLDKLKVYNRCKTAVLEQWVTPENDIEQTVKKEEQWAAEGITYLKNLGRFEVY